MSDLNVNSNADSIQVKDPKIDSSKLLNHMVDLTTIKGSRHAVPLRTLTDLVILQSKGGLKLAIIASRTPTLLSRIGPLVKDPRVDLLSVLRDNVLQSVDSSSKDSSNTVRHLAVRTPDKEAMATGDTD